MLERVTGNAWVQAVALSLVLVLVVLIAYVLSPVLVPLLFAFLVAYVLDPVVDFFERRRIPRGLTIGMFSVLLILVALAIPLFFVPRLIVEANRLTESATADQEGSAISQWVGELVSDLPLEQQARNLGLIEPDAEWNLRALLAERVGGYVKDNAERLLQAIIPTGQRAGAGIAQLFASLGRGAMAFVIFLANFALFSFVAGYLLKDYDRIVAGAADLVPPRHRAKSFQVLRDIDGQVRSFLRGQLLVCLFLGVTYGIGLLISGTPFAILIALVGGIFSFVPYVGPTITLIPALSLTLLQFGVDWHVIGVVTTVAVAQMLEGTVITPNVVGREVGLGPVWVILALLVFGNLLGFLGLLIAVPIAAALKVLVLEAVAYYRASSVFEEEAAGSETGGES